MRRLTAPATQRLKRAALAVACVAVTGMAWVGYSATDSQAALAALWSLCVTTP